MSRISIMTLGLLLILIGIQLNLVESFVLTPKTTELWNQRFVGYEFQTVPGNYVANSDGYYSNSDASPVRIASGNNSNYPYSTPNYQRFRNNSTPVFASGYRTRSTENPVYSGPQKMLSPPSWLCWPPIFLGAVLFLYGAASRP